MDVIFQLELILKLRIPVQKRLVVIQQGGGGLSAATMERIEIFHTRFYGYMSGSQGWKVLAKEDLT
jgi:hypothetical protein